MKKQEVIDALSVIQKSHFVEATMQIDQDGYPGNRRAYLYNAIDPSRDELYPPPYLIELAFKNATGNKLPERFFAGIGKDTGHFDQLKSCGFLVESKIDPKRIDKAMTNLFNRASLFAQFIEDPASIFKNAKQEHDLIKEAMREENDRWAPKPNHFQPVVLFRHMLFQNIKDGKSIDSDLIESIKNEILSKNVSAKYNLSQKFRDLINNYPEKNYFQAWKNPFSLVFPFFYSKKFKQYTREQLSNIDNFLRDRLDLKDVKSNIVGFEGARNMGADHAWIALYPSHAPSVQEAYQLFIGIDKKGYTASLYKGHKVMDENFKEKKAQFKNIEECHEIMAGFVEEWKTLNNSLNKNKGVDRNYWVYSPGENAMYWDTFYEEGILGLGWNELGDISRFNDKDEIVKELQRIEETDSSKKNDATANWDFIHRVNVGDVIIAKKGRQELLGYGIVTSGYYYDPSRPDQHHLRKIEWKLKGSWPISDNLSLKTLTIITEYGCELPEFEFYYQRLLADMGVDVPRIKKEIMPINQILYGPPGTGKTYHLKTELFPRYTARESSVTKDDFVKEIVGDLSWWKVVALVLKEMKAGKVSDIREHKFLKVKESLSNSNTVKQTIWGQLQAHTVEECVAVNVKRKMTPLIFFKDENSNWRLDEQGYEQVEDEISSILEEINNFESKKDKEIKRYEFVTFHQSYAYEDFIEGIKPVMEEESDGDIQYEIKDGLFKKLCQRAGNDPSNSYAIFIDEINRGNVSSIFGELITLIEDDKRLGSENAMTATLPYSRSIFGVPRNVHIYGTMNTADRSVEALDTALRRRFSFLEMLPDSSKLEVAVEGIRLSELLTILNDRIEVLVDRDHTIGHAFFINDKNLDDLRNTFANKVIPLLQEYFYGDYGKMEMVIGSAFFEVKDTTKVKFAVKPEDFDPEGKVYHIVDVADKKTMSDDDFKEALTKLIKGA